MLGQKGPTATDHRARLVSSSMTRLPVAVDQDVVDLLLDGDGSLVVRNDELAFVLEDLEPERERPSGAGERREGEQRERVEARRGA